MLAHFLRLKINKRSKADEMKWKWHRFRAPFHRFNRDMSRVQKHLCHFIFLWACIQIAHNDRHTHYAKSVVRRFRYNKHFLLINYEASVFWSVPHVSHNSLGISTIFFAEIRQAEKSTHTHTSSGLGVWKPSPKVPFVSNQWFKLADLTD